MSLAQRKPTMTAAEFLDWVQHQEGFWEFDGHGPVPRGGAPHAMTGGTSDHSAIGTNLAVALGRRLRGRPCRFYNGDLGVATGPGPVRYPDGSVVCRPVPRGTLAVPDPVVVFEVLSPSTQRTDRVRKLAEYGATPSVLRYVLLEQEEAAATVLSRPDGGSEWTARVVGPGGTLDLPEAGLSVPLDELYEGVRFDDDGPAAEATAAPAADAPPPPPPGTG